MRKLALILLAVIIALLSFFSYTSYIREHSGIISNEPPPRNIYILTASGLRAEHLSSYLYQPIQTPAMDYLAFDGIRFTRAYTTSTESLTAHASLLSGLYPFHEPVRQTTEYLLDLSRHGMPENLVTLPDILTKKGYRTAAFLSDPELRFPSFFSDFFHHTFTGDQMLYPWETAYSSEHVCRLAREWIQQNRTIPQFVLINFHEPTLPFHPPAPYNKQYTRFPYDGEIAGLDEQIGLFMDLLKEAGLFQNSIVVLTAPYGETLSDGSRYTSPNDSILHVPLVISAPGLLPRKEQYDAQVSLVDVFPTILELIGEKIDSRIDGLPMFKKEERAQITRPYILGMVPFPKFLGFTPDYWVRTPQFLYVHGPDEVAVPHQSHKIGEDQIAAWVQQARNRLKEDGIRLTYDSKLEVETDPTALLETVLGLAREERYEVALDLLLLFATQMPQNSYLESLAGTLALASQDSDTALRSLRRAVELAPTARPLPWLARAALASGNPAEALSALKSYRAVSPLLSYDVRSTLAVALLEAGKQEEALVEFDTVLRQNPRYAEAYLYRGRIWNKRNRLHEAESDWKTAIEMKPDYAPAYQELARLYEQHGKPADAIPYLRHLLRLEPDQYEAMLQLATLHQKSRNPAEARKLLQHIILHSDDESLIQRAKQALAES